MGGVCNLAAVASSLESQHYRCEWMHKANGDFSAYLERVQGSRYIANTGTLQGHTFWHRVF